MADDDWQLEAVHEQLNVFDNLRTPYEKMQSTDLCRVMAKVQNIRRLHLKMKQQANYNTEVHERNLSAEIIKHPNGDEIKLSFIVIVTNMEMNGSLCKMPIFVIMSGGKNKFIDMNCTLFNTWDAFLKLNRLPPCQYCFPVGGQYRVGAKLKIDFASSPAANWQKVSTIWKCVGFVVAIGVVVSSFFFTIPPINHTRFDSLLSIANEFVPGIKEYGRILLRGVTIVERLKSGKMDIVQVLPELWNLLKWVKENFSEEISGVFRKVQAVLGQLYSWLREKLSSLFGNASDSEQLMFVAVMSKVEKEIVTVELEAEEILDASIKNNCQSQMAFVATATTIHAQVNNGGTGYTNTIFRNAKTESALQNGMKKGNENPHPITSDLLDVSKYVAENLGKRTLNSHLNIFEALNCIVKDEFKKKIQLYGKMLTAAKAGAGHQIDVEAFNCSLGINGDVKKHYWEEALMSVMDPRLAYPIKEKMETLEKQKKLLILPLVKEDEDNVPGVYRLVGVHGANKFSANDLIKALKESQFELSKRDLVVNETSSMIMIQTEELTLAAMQEVNSENTSEGILLVVKTEV